MSNRRTIREEHAANLWCPFAREMASEGGSYNRDFNNKTGSFASSWCMCIGSLCMAWVFDELDDEKGCCGIVGNKNEPSRY